MLPQLHTIITNLISSKRREFLNFWKTPFLVRIGSLYVMTVAERAGEIQCKKNAQIIVVQL